MPRLVGSLDVPNFSFPCLATPALELLTQSDAGLSKIVVIVAPTGYGKTVLMASWCERLQEANSHTFWVCLDERDKQITPLFARIERQLFAEATSLNPFEAVHESDLPVDQRIENILHAIRAIPGESYLFIDNLQFCEDEALAPLLRALLDETPESFHLVIAGLQEPPLSLGRATLEGKVCRIGFLDLALRESEVKALLGKALAQKIGDVGVARIVELSEGWPAAVRLMQIVLNNEADSEAVIRGFAGSDVDLAEMLNRQVLERLGDKFRRFLLEVSQLRTFNEEMCSYALGYADSAKYIQQLLHNNLFIIPLDRNRTKYRLHGLFGGFLKTEARKVLPVERIKQVLIKASEWCERNKEFADAIDYATSAGSLVHAAAILDRVAASFVRDRGDLSKFISWVEQLRESSVALEWETEFWYLWALVFHRRYEFATRQLGPLRNRLENGEVSKQDDRYADYVRRLEIISITIDTYTDNLSEADARAVSWLEASLEDDPFDVATIATAAGIYGACHFEFALARKHFGIAQARIAQAQSIYGEAWVTAASCFVGLHEGKFSETYEIAERIVAKVCANTGQAPVLQWLLVARLNWARILRPNAIWKSPWKMPLCMVWLTAQRLV